MTVRGKGCGNRDVGRDDLIPPCGGSRPHLFAPVGGNKCHCEPVRRLVRQSVLLWCGVRGCGFQSGAKGTRARQTSREYARPHRPLRNVRRSAAKRRGEVTPPYVHRRNPFGYCFCTRLPHSLHRADRVVRSYERLSTPFFSPSPPAKISPAKIFLRKRFTFAY